MRRRIESALGDGSRRPADQPQAAGLPDAFTLSVPVVAGVVGAVFATSIVAAVVPVLGAGRLSVVGALTRGSMPSAGGRPGPLLRRAHDLPLRAPVRLGIAAAIAHPVGRP